MIHVTWTTLEGGTFVGDANYGYYKGQRKVTREGSVDGYVCDDHGRVLAVVIEGDHFLAVPIEDLTFHARDGHIAP